MQQIASEDISNAVHVLKQGGVVVFPTETAYGLAADARSESATKRIYEIKGRSEEKSLPLIAASCEMVEQYAGIPRGLLRLTREYWPGPLTLILPMLESELSSHVVHNGEMAIRVSSHPIAQALSEGMGAPIVSTSANKSGQPACYSVSEVRAQLGDAPDLYLDAGQLSPEPPSTIVTLDDYGLPYVLREGPIDID